MADPAWDAAVVGGGFYGCCIALHLRRLGLARVCIVEAGPRLLGRASYANQARIHHGYHYPRDFTTAYRSRISFRAFSERYKEAVDDGFLALYAVARRGSHVTAAQFERMMSSVGAPLSKAGRRRSALFSPGLVEAVYEAEEFAFDAARLAGMLEADLRASGVRVMLDTRASVSGRSAGTVGLALSGPGGDEACEARAAFNCTYGMLAHLPGAPGLRARLRYQISEVCLAEPPPELRGVGITVMDGPFFSCMPFPARGLHSLTHVRWTHHETWEAGAPGRADPYAELAASPRASAFEAMRRDAARMLPAMAGAVHRGSLWEVKATLAGGLSGDGRPILFEGDPAPGQVVSVMGGKLDNIFDALAEIDARQGLTA